MNPTIAFIGVGIMGRGIVNNLKKLNYPLQIYSRNPHKIQELEDENTKVCSIGTVIENADYTILCLTEDSTIQKFLEESKYFERAKGFLIDFGTTSLEMTRYVQQNCNSRNIRFIDSPMTGSKLAAQNAQIVFMVGCDKEEDLRACEFLWKATGKKVIHCGSVGYGQLTKIALNMVQAGILQVYMEGLMLSKKIGISDEVFWKVIENSAASSGISDFKGKCIRERNFETNFSLKNMNKDLNHAMRLASQTHASLPLSSVLKSIYESGMAKSLGELDFVSLLQINEELNNLL